MQKLVEHLLNSGDSTFNYYSARLTECTQVKPLLYFTPQSAVKETIIISNSTLKEIQIAYHTCWKPMPKCAAQDTKKSVRKKNYFMEIFKFSDQSLPLEWKLNCYNNYLTVALYCHVDIKTT